MILDSGLARQIAGRLDKVATEIAEIQEVLAAALLAQSTSDSSATSGLMIGSAESRTDFIYKWPDGKVVTNVSVRKFAVTCKDAKHHFMIGTEKGGREAYQRSDRGRIVVFMLERSGSPRPLVEFAESDLEPDLYVAGVPLPGKPRSLATEDHLDQLRQVPHLSKADLRRTEEVYESSLRAPSLRLVVGVDNTHLMIEHAHWVGALRGILR